MNMHLSQSISGPLKHWHKRDWQHATKWIKRKDGTRYTADELKDEFLHQLSLGREVVPIGECDNFDFKLGCLGHPEQPLTPQHEIKG